MKAFLFASVMAVGFTSVSMADDTPQTPATPMSGTVMTEPVTTSGLMMETTKTRRGLFGRLRGRSMNNMPTTTAAPMMVTPAPTTTSPAAPAPMPSTKVSGTEKVDKDVVQASGTTTPETTAMTTPMTMDSTYATTSTKRMGLLSRMRARR